MTLRTLCAVAIACASFALAVGTAEAGPKQRPIITCDQRGCSDLVPITKAAPAKVRHDANGNDARIAAARGYCRTDTAAGEIVIACDVAERMKGFIADVVARGFSGRVKCFSLSRNHVPRSLHFTARACDFAQRGWNKTVAVMYRVGDLTRKWGLRNGCSFGDCGHVDAGHAVAAKPRRAHVADAVQP